jgi:hypothetical protein
MRVVILINYYKLYSSTCVYYQVNLSLNGVQMENNHHTPNLKKPTNFYISKP